MEVFVRIAAVRVLDGSAMGLSGLCLVHCLALPVAAAFLPALGVWAGAEWVHVVFVMFAAPLSALALLRPAHGRGSPAPLVALGGLGIVLLAAGAFGPPAAETPVTVAGSLCLACAHLWNWRRHSRLHSGAC
jgi:hypothetical protein